METESVPTAPPPLDGAEAAAILAGWPGPALRLTADGALCAANARCVPLDTGGGTWREDLSWWVASGGPRLDSTRSVPVATGSGPGVVEFAAVPLPDGEVLLLGRDVTLERRLRHALTESRQRYKDLVDISSDFAWETGPDGRFAFVSPAGAIGYRAEELLGRHPADLVLPDFADQPLPFDTRVPIERTEVWLRDRSGEPACLISSAVPLTGPGGEWLGARGACRDITDARLRGMELSRVRLREKYLGFIVSSTRDDVDPTRTLEIAAGVAVNATGAAGALVFAKAGEGYGPAARQGTLPPVAADALPALLAAAAESAEGCETVAGPVRLLAGRTLFRNEVNGAVLAWRPAEETWSADDISMVAAIADHVGVAVAQARYQERLKTLSERDGLTGLYNRRTFMELLEQRLERHRGGSSALLYFDLDNFKAVNDLLGHTAGDGVLKAVGTLLVRLARPGDLTARLGGDEFVLWIERVDEAQALRVADRLLREAAEFLRPLSAAPDRPLGVSIGVALYAGGGGEPAQGLVDRGDHAMYAAKRQGKGNRALAPAAAIGSGTAGEDASAGGTGGE
ncbi:sensor domain-containing diguanylate cyclase [Rhodocista pekingensis]|uniref:Diguanylate cyclase domain-containing protein n=1 Tax=Rhodocista pekingensis TaxID=201185 RepID=A0ABW2KWM5_9PROT